MNTLLRLCALYESRLDEPVLLEKPNLLAHLRWMLAQIAGMTDLAKANRWMGFVQGVLFSEGLNSIDELRSHVRWADGR